MSSERFHYLAAVERLPVDFVCHVVRAVDQTQIALIQFTEQSLTPKLGHERLIFAQEAEVRDDRFDGDDEIAAGIGAIYGRFDALLEIGEQVACITAEHFIATLTAEHYLELLGRDLRDHELRERPRPRDWIIKVVHDIVHVPTKMVGRDIDDVQDPTRPIRHDLRIGALVIAGHIRESTVKTDEPFRPAGFAAISVTKLESMPPDT